MISPQPTQLIKYLGPKRNIVPNGIKRRFYLSFEDALWDLLENKEIKKDAKIMMPDFYCFDVVNNIKLHGYKPVFYKIKNDLSVDLQNLTKRLKSQKPDVVIVFHPVGITSNLLKNTKWIKLLLKDKTILVEDCVHRLVSPKKIEIYKENHFLINSLRKVVPLQGSSIYGRDCDLDFNTPPIYQSLFYSLKVNILWFLMNTFWGTKKSDLAEKLMLKGYEIIGDAKLPARGLRLFKFLEEFIDYETISIAKILQTSIYKSELVKINTVNINKSDMANLRAWPVILPLKIADKILKNIRDQGLLLRFELNDSPWSRKQKIIYLPMGPHLKENDIHQICQIIKNAWQT